MTQNNQWVIVVLRLLPPVGGIHASKISLGLTKVNHLCCCRDQVPVALEPSLPLSRTSLPVSRNRVSGPRDP